MNNTTSFICVINNKSTTKLDEGQCVIGNIAATLYKFDFGYFSMGFLGITIFMSIFGGIKQNYRWFILYQAIWDLLKSYEYSCQNALVNYVKPSPGCLYYFNNGAGSLDWTIYNIIVNNIYAPLVLLSITRFIAVYFVKFYDKLTRGYRIIYIIFVFNLLLIFWDTEVLISEWQRKRDIWLLNECKIKENSNSTTLCTYKNTEDFISIFSFFLFKTCTYGRMLKPGICLLISSFSTLMIVFKMVKQAKFQLKHNRRDFFNSARVTAVIAFQTITNFLIFVLQFFNSFALLVDTFTFSTVMVITTKYYEEGKNYTGYIELRLPLWVDGPLGLTSKGGQQIITQARILIESIIILCIMTGYREAIVILLRKLYVAIRNPYKFIKSFKKISSRTSWT